MDSIYIQFVGDCYNSHPFQSLTDYILLCSHNDNNKYFMDDINNINYGLCPSNEFIQYCWLVLLIEKRNNILFNERLDLINILLEICSLKKYCLSCTPLDDALHSKCDKNFNLKRDLRFISQRFINYLKNDNKNKSKIKSFIE